MKKPRLSLRKPRHYVDIVTSDNILGMDSQKEPATVGYTLWESSYWFVPPIRHRHVLFPLTLDRAWEDVPSVRVILFIWTVVWPRSLTCRWSPAQGTLKKKGSFLLMVPSWQGSMVTGGMVAGAEAEDLYLNHKYKAERVSCRWLKTLTLKALPRGSTRESNCIYRQPLLK